MTQVIVHEMRYCGDKLNCDINVVHYCDEYYHDYRSICCDSFRDLSIATNLDPNSFYTLTEMNQRKSQIYLVFSDKEMVGSVEIHENIIDHLFVNRKYQNKGYGKKLLYFAINRLQEEGMNDITLFVADLNKVAIQLYLNNGFRCTNTTIENW